MAADHALQARIENVKADARARRRRAQVELERRMAHAKTWWHQVDKRLVAAAAASAIAASAALVWMWRKE